MTQAAEIEAISGSGGSAVRYPLDRDVVQIGRLKQSDIVLYDPKVSRRHARITRDGDAYMIERVSRRNPLLLNGVAVEKGILTDGDAVSLGDSLLCFRLLGSQAPSEGVMRPDCITLDAADRDLLLRGINEEDLQALQRAKSDLLALYRAGQVVNTCLSVTELCRKTAEMVIEEVPAVDCCSLHILTGDRGELDCKAVMFRSEKLERIPVAFSRTMLNQVIAEKKAILTYDASGDRRFESSQSITSLRIHAAMCVPIQVQGRLTGVIQAHTLDAQHTFTVDDLKLLTAFGRMAGVAIENARLYEELEANRAMEQDKARLMQVMMHELKSPISGARMMAETLRMQIVPEDEQPRFLGRIVARLDSMLQWITDALDLSRLKSGEALGKCERLDLAATTRQVVEEYREPAETKGLELRVDTPESPVPALLVDSHVHLVVSNLVSNAVKYTPRGSVTVGLASDADWATLTVEDTGMGIPEKDIPNMFGEFFRASNARKSDIEGSGIGLASVKCMVEGCGGTLDLESTEGQGTTFTLRLPLSDKATVR